jgi:hypothetical protein
MRPKLQKQSALKLAVELSREAEDKATSRELRRIPPQAGAGGLQVAGCIIFLLGKKCFF